MATVMGRQDGCQALALTVERALLLRESVEKPPGSSGCLQDSQVLQELPGTSPSPPQAR